MCPTDVSTKSSLRARYEALRANPLILDLTRGDPPDEACRLALPMLADQNYISRDGINCLTYSRPKYFRGLLEARELFGAYLGVLAENVFIGLNSSLRMMTEVFGLLMAEPARLEVPNPKVIVIEPGYDRHFDIPGQFGVDLVGVSMLANGPNMDMVERLVQDPSVIGMICVPKYSNPTGETYSLGICKQLATIETAYPEFRIVWDLAYQEHHLYGDHWDTLPYMFDLCRDAGHEDRPLIFGSTSKIDFASAGLAMFAASESNLSAYEAWLRKRTIGENKLEQFRRVNFFKDVDGIRAHMKKRVEILRPKFDAVDEILTRELGGAGFAHWNVPYGGYFICLWVPGYARRVVELCAEMGLLLTPVGAGFIGGRDPDNSLIRLAPTFPPLPDLKAKLPAIPIAVQMALSEK